ncbi:MAG TPA: hypothetical protein VMC05_03490 [Xanthobacteraceae bacterium]|nr:hypothetical protein [Xanthobacteraceae bacterium]
MTTSDGQSIERLREYLRTLKPQARSMLIQELERTLLRGEESSGNELVLQELRRAIRADAQPVPRIGDAARLFFAPVEPFLIDGPADHKRVGRLARASLEPIWAWIGRDLIPAEAKALGEDIHRALLADDRAKADQVVKALHERAVSRIREIIAGTQLDEKARRRLGVQVGTPRALEDLATLVALLSLRDILGDLGRRLPGQIRVLDREEVNSLTKQIDAVVAQSHLEANGIRKADVYLYGCILVMSRLASPWQLIRIATRAAESDDTARVAETPYAAAVTLVLGEAEAMVSELRAELRAGRPIVSMLKAIHDVARGLRSEMDLSVESAWSRQLAAIRAEVSSLLKAEIEATPGFVRRLLRPRPSKDILSGSLLDSVDVNEAEMRVEFVEACRQYAGELAVNEVTTRAHSELSLYLETGTKVLLDSLRHAGDTDRPFRQSQVEAAIRFCRSIFGNEYAGLLAKAAEVAVQTGTVERRPARA